MQNIIEDHISETILKDSFNFNSNFSKLCCAILNVYNFGHLMKHKKNFELIPIIKEYLHRFGISVLDRYMTLWKITQMLSIGVVFPQIQKRLPHVQMIFI